MAVFIGNGFWVVLPYDLVKDLSGLWPSPLGCKEERTRRPRLVCDHTFFGVNQCTYLRTPEEAMQFGGALGRVLRLIRHAHPGWGPILLSKCDIKDGFYPMFLEADDCPRLAVTLPHYEGEEPLVAIPLVCSMGLTWGFLLDKFLKEFLCRNSAFLQFLQFLKEFLEKELPCRIILLRFAGTGIPCRNSLRNFPPFPDVSTRLVTSQVPGALESLLRPFKTQ